MAELTTTAGIGSGLFSPEDPAESSAAASELEPFSLLFLFCVTLFRGAPWAVTRCFLRYHLFFTTFSHSEHDTPENMLKENFVKSHKFMNLCVFTKFLYYRGISYNNSNVDNSYKIDSSYLL